MPRKPSKDQPTLGLTKDHWIASFVHELRNVREHTSPKVANAVALQVHAKDPAADPEAAARAWHKANPTP